MKSLVTAVSVVARSAPAQLWTVIAAGAVAGIAAVPAAWVTKVLVDGLGSGTLSPTRAAGLAVLAAAFSMAATQVVYVAAIAGSALEARSAVVTESRLSRSASAFPGTEFLEDAAHHDSLGLARRGARLVPTVVPNAIVEVVSSGIAFVGYGVLLWASWPFMVAALLAISIPTAYIQVRVNRTSSRIVEANAGAHRWHEYFSRLFATPAAARDMRLHNASQFFEDKLVISLNDAHRAEVAAVKKSTVARMALVALHGVVGAAGAAVVAAGAARGTISVGELVLFTTAVLAIQTRATSLLNLQGRLRTTLTLFEHYDRFIQESAEAAAAARGTEPSPLQDCIRLENVWFRYSEGSDWVLRGVDLTLPVGTTTGLVGLNGAGKSTLIRLLMRFNSPTRGRILWDGVDIATLDANAYRRRVTGVLQDRPRYELTLHDNVALGRGMTRAQPGAVLCALSEAALLATADELPHGVDTLLSPERRDSTGANGIALSGGQWDRVALARSAYSNGPDGRPDLVVLDEPNAGLDPRSEAQLLEDLVALDALGTRLLVTHRMSMLTRVHQIAVLDAGRIVEFGVYDDLMASGGLFHELFTTQAQLFAAGGGVRAVG